MKYEVRQWTQSKQSNQEAEEELKSSKAPRTPSPLPTPASHSTSAHLHHQHSTSNTTECYYKLTSHAFILHPSSFRVVTSSRCHLLSNLHVRNILNSNPHPMYCFISLYAQNVLNFLVILFFLL
mmetsp:Transcript_11494/g.30537  ORF Transcript_11494/g.30537 Transcript_11494/m.30537 type:complete len:124 (+) Transcript_11494:2216-2587(+)